MKVFELLKNPFIKIIGVILVLYFALFADKRNPQSLGNRLSTENIKKNFNEAQRQGRFIASNIRAAKKYNQEQELKRQRGLTEKISFSDLEVGKGEQKAACGDEVEISYGVYDQNGNQLEFIDLEKLVIGSKRNEILEKNIIGMNRDGIRNILIPQYFPATDKKLLNFLKISNSPLKYQVTLRAFGQKIPALIAACENLAYQN